MFVLYAILVDIMNWSDECGMSIVSQPSLSLSAGRQEHSIDTILHPLHTVTEHMSNLSANSDSVLVSPDAWSCIHSISPNDLDPPSEVLVLGLILLISDDVAVQDILIDDTKQDWITLMIP